MLGVQELVLILVVVLIIFGPGKLPKIGSALGEGIAEFKKASRKLEGEDPKAIPPGSPDEPVDATFPDDSRKSS